MPTSDLEQRVMRKLTWKLMPLLCACFMAAFIDRVNVGFAKEQMMADLAFSNAVYGLGAGIFFIGYFLFEVPSNLILERVGARLWIARIMVVWGLISACMVFVNSTASFYLLRFFLGAAEAGFFPGVILYLTYWFPKAYRSRTIALFMTAAVVSNIIGSPASGLLLELDGALGLRGWKWLFLIEALPSIVLGVVLFLILPNRPREAKWLSETEREFIETRISAEQAEQADVVKHDSLTLLKAFTDPRVLLLAAIYFLQIIGAYGLDFFMPTLIKLTFTWASPGMVGVLAAIPPAFAIFAMILHGRSSDRRQERKWHLAVAIAWAGSGLFLASLPVPPIVALLALALAVSGRWSAIAPFWGVATAFLSGRAAAGAIALINSIGNLGGFAGPYLMGWFKDQTGGYTIGLRVLAGLMFLSALLALSIRVRREAPALAPAPAAQET